jgi:transposase-like protein
MHSEVELSIPRDRQGRFEPKIIPKGTTRLPEIERTVLALYGSGMSTRDIADELHRAYGIDASPTFISDVTGAASLRMSGSGGIVPWMRSIRWHFLTAFG